jgi:hypothetical protein
MANAKKTRIPILNPVAGCEHTSLDHARRYVNKGKAEWVGSAIRFIVAVSSKPSHHGPNLTITIGVVKDSGQSGFLRYPIPHQGGMVRGLSGQYPVLAKCGAGML